MPGVPLRYDFTAGQLAKKHLNPQLSHCGMIEFHLDRLKIAKGTKNVSESGWS